MPTRKLSLSFSKTRDIARDHEDLGMEVGPIKLRLGDQETVFLNGEWTPGIYI